MTNLHKIGKQIRTERNNTLTINNTPTTSTPPTFTPLTISTWPIMNPNSSTLNNTDSTYSTISSVKQTQISQIIAAEQTPDSLQLPQLGNTIPRADNFTESMFGQQLPENVRKQLDQLIPVVINTQRMQFRQYMQTQSPTALSPSTVPFKGNWTDSFKLKNGETIYHTPQNIRFGFITAGKGISMNNSNINGKIYNINVQTDSTREEFIAALQRDGNL